MFLEFGGYECDSGCHDARSQRTNVAQKGIKAYRPFAGQAPTWITFSGCWCAQRTWVHKRASETFGPRSKWINVGRVEGRGGEGRGGEERKGRGGEEGKGRRGRGREGGREREREREGKRKSKWETCVSAGAGKQQTPGQTERKPNQAGGVLVSEKTHSPARERN